MHINGGKSMELARDVLKINIRSDQRFYMEYKDNGEVVKKLLLMMSRLNNSDLG